MNAFLTPMGPLEFDSQRQMALTQVVSGVKTPVMSRKELQLVPCFGQLCDPPTFADGSEIRSISTFDDTKGSMVSKKGLIEIAKMHHIPVREGRNATKKKELKRKIRAHLVQYHFNVEPNTSVEEIPQVLGQ